VLLTSDVVEAQISRSRPQPGWGLDLRGQGPVAYGQSRNSTSDSPI